jgi:succinate dehydrogenase flavin-adding protein (antitoxin of CptAB toxin-antitoxin module)
VANINLQKICTDFAVCRTSLLELVLQDESSGLALTKAQQDLSIAFDQLLAAFAPDADRQVRSGLTEIHRLLKLADRELQFWQSAKQSETRSQRQQQLLTKLQQIADWEQVFQTANNAHDQKIEAEDI